MPYLLGTCQSRQYGFDLVRTQDCHGWNLIFYHPDHGQFVPNDELDRSAMGPGSYAVFFYKLFSGREIHTNSEILQVNYYLNIKI